MHYITHSEPTLVQTVHIYHRCVLAWNKAVRFDMHNYWCVQITRKNNKMDTLLNGLVIYLLGMYRRMIFFSLQPIYRATLFNFIFNRTVDGGKPFLWIDSGFIMDNFINKRIRVVIFITIFLVPVCWFHCNFNNISAKPRGSLTITVFISILTSSFHYYKFTTWSRNISYRNRYSKGPNPFEGKSMVVYPLNYTDVWTSF